MGSESNSTPTTLTDDNSQNPGSDPLKPLDGAEQGAPGETTRITSPPSVFVNTEPIREDQVQNAVKFLSHPKVRGSPVMYRRSFLEKKGLSCKEIDEAFRRVPDPPPPATTTPAAIPNKDGQSTLPINSQPQVQAQAPQPAVPPPSGVVSKMRARFHWSHAILAIGFLAASGAGTALVFKNAVVPRLKSWIRKVVLEEDGDDSLEKNTLKPNPAEEAAAAAKAAAAAASDVAKASQEMLNSKLEERKYQEAFMNMMDVQLGEMKNMSNAIRKLESSREAIISSNNHIEAVRSTSRTGPSNTQLMNSLFDQDYETVSYSGLKQATANGIANIDLGSGRPPSAPASTEPSVAPHPKSYMEIMEMIQRGEKPPGIKPWETAQAQNGSYYTEGSNMRSQANLPTSQLNGDGMEPSWQRKNVRISEYEAEDESKSSYRAPATEQVVRRAWVPPQPPPIAMAEAATAIRQPKQIIQPARSDEEKLIAYPSVEVDELQRITKLAESGGQVEINEVNADESLSVVRGDQEVDGIEAM
ncbi:peroxisomal membrane protein PEX14-like isoform X2 [Papaver somniferum]|uniref:peroxisomal membrane protein PEX14-like isoform X2 n=1 Tax=Papaver somniferum TaxID=3469 RepID=UPI000E6F865C|nr:peroxisomal membrane protein PEX14-like isoform X2 [Papaver somniferum]